MLRYGLGVLATRWKIICLFIPFLGHPTPKMILGSFTKLKIDYVCIINKLCHLNCWNVQFNRPAGKAETQTLWSRATTRPLGSHYTVELCFGYYPNIMPDFCLLHIWIEEGKCYTAMVHCQKCWRSSFVETGFFFSDGAQDFSLNYTRTWAEFWGHNSNF